MQGNRACGRDQRAFRSPFGNLRGSPLISLYCSQLGSVAAALSAAMTILRPQGIAPAGARRGLSGRPRHPFGSLLISLYDPQRRQVAAALLAAVTTTKPQEIAPTSHGRTSREEKSSLFPATLRERGPGGEVLLLEKQPLPRSFPTSPPRLIERLFLCVEAGY